MSIRFIAYSLYLKKESKGVAYVITDKQNCKNDKMIKDATDNDNLEEMGYIKYGW